MPLQTGAQVWSYTPPPAANPTWKPIWEQITLGKPFNEGGTALIFEKDPFPASRTLIKVFHVDMTPETRTEFFNKLWAMTEKELEFHRAMPVVAWPKSILFSRKDAQPVHMIGCTVHAVDNAVPLLDVAVDPDTAAFTLGRAVAADDYRQIALNVAAGFANLHKHRIWFGDANSRNILIDKKTLHARFIDADSYGLKIVPRNSTTAVRHPPGASTIGFRSPRAALMAKVNGGRLPDYSESDDNYALAINLFMLMVPGFHPWGSDQEPGEDLATIRRFRYGGPRKDLADDCVQMRAYNALPPAIRTAFVRTFHDGQPVRAADWHAMIKYHWRYLQGQFAAA